MSVRILYLHGQGTSASIFRKQTGNASTLDDNWPCWQRQPEHMRQMLPAHYQFYFLDGRHKCEADQEVRDFLPPPYWAWYSTPATHSVLDAHDQILSIIREHGEFDAGAAVAASLLLHQEMLGEEPVFKAAIFIGSPVPFSHQLDVGIDCSTSTSCGIGDKPQNTQESGDASGETAQYQMFHADVDGVRIQVPMGHSQEPVRLCRTDVSTVFQHMGGHEVPRAYTEEICDVIEAVFSRIRE
ncbi:hypothetical protein F5Y03DRAFT_410557 [Xylaria venustula]|nr:hypothetical protein F5Y03DRAFT_410557 [Xylaria venustula]